MQSSCNIFLKESIFSMVKGLYLGTLLEYVNLIIETALVLVSLQIGNEVITFVNLQIRKYVN